MPAEEFKNDSSRIRKTRLGCPRQTKVPTEKNRFTDVCSAIIEFESTCWEPKWGNGVAVIARARRTLVNSSIRRCSTADSSSRVRACRPIHHIFYRPHRFAMCLVTILHALGRPQGLRYERVGLMRRRPGAESTNRDRSCVR